jgi:putative transcriptional regulator
MSSESTVYARRLPNGKIVQEMPDGTTRPFKSKTDWAVFDALTEEEITAAALSDPDNPPLTDEQLAQGRHVPNPKEIRQKLHMTQEQFAEQFQVPLGTLRDWEQGVSIPDSAAKNYLRVIAKNPQAVLEALAG